MRVMIFLMELKEDVASVLIIVLHACLLLDIMAMKSPLGIMEVLLLGCNDIRLQGPR